jgi:ABC-type branched-subunit amino acid transport system substrate-binding protein
MAMNGSRVNALLAASAFGLLLGLAACASDRVAPPGETVQPAQPELPPEIRVGLLLPLSGPAEALGRDMLDAAEMALFDVGDNDLVLLPQDTGGNPSGARRAAGEAINQGAEVLLGPLFGQAVAAVSPIAAAANIRVLAFSNDASVATEGTFLLGFRPEEQVRRVVRYALASGALARPEPALPGQAAGQQDALSGTLPLDQPAPDQPAPDQPALDQPPFSLRVPRIAGLAPDDPYGRATLGALRAVTIESGGTLGETLFYPPQGADPSPVVRRISAYDQRAAALEAERARLAQSDDPQAAQRLSALETLDTMGGPPFDAILLADGGDRLRSVASLLTFFDVAPTTTRFLGTMRWQADPRVLAEGALQGGWFAAPEPRDLAAFEGRFRDIFGRTPDPLAALAYDATALAVVVARDLGDRSFAEETLINAQGFAGATGLFRLRADGLAEHGLAVLEVRGGTTRTLDPAPTTFVDELALLQ